MNILLAFLVGVAVAVLVMRWARVERAGRQPGPVAPGADLAPEAAASRLQELATVLGLVGETSAHPRDLGTNATFSETVAILASASTPLTVVTDYAIGANYMMAAAACAALCTRADREEAGGIVARHLPNLSPWPVFYALEYFTTLANRPALGSIVLRGQEYWPAHPLLPAMLAEHFSKRLALGDNAAFGEALAAAPPAQLAQAETLLRAIDHPAARALLADLAEWRHQALDRTYLQTFGRFVERDTAHDLLAEYPAVAQPLAIMESAVLNYPPRSVLVVGEPRVGKTSLIMLAASRLAAQGWTMFEAGAASLMAGQQYFGQLEERLQRLTTELDSRKRVVWYAPDFLQLALSGTHTGQSASVLDQVLPALTSGRLVLASEATPDALAAVLQRRPGLRSVVEIVRLEQPADADVDAVARTLADRVGRLLDVRMEGALVETATHLARHYLGSDQMPGAVLDLIKLTAQRVAAHDGTDVRREDVLATLSQQTGMPALVLDDRERVDLASLRRFFSSRVIGQDEAVDAVVDRIAMLKAGLTDPGKPIAVFLFAGPTGTGKTELAKTVAGFLFGSDDRLIRLDMSEFQTAESTRKIVGEADQAGSSAHSLTGRIRKQPFSVVLLDEFEKAHPNTWDLFLQVFDDGRLTDATGHTVDFRHCIIILTSNLGATVQAGRGPGFASQSGGFSHEHVVRAVHQSFRPEFVNRLDAIIVFRPLTRELMRGILAKELAGVLERRGLRDREWAVEWEPSAIDFLLDRGFSMTMGARPLKRAIDRYLLAPLAATLVEHRFPEGDQFLFVRSDGRAIQVEFVDPDAAAEPAAPLEPEPAAGGPTLARMMLHATGAASERDALVAALRRVEDRLQAAEWRAVEEALTGAMREPEFWKRPDRFRSLARYALLDRVRAAADTARGLHARLDRSAARGGRYSRDLIARLATQVYLLQHGVEDALADAPVEIVIGVQAVLDGGRDPAAAAGWCGRLVEMYRRWASHRHMQADEIPSPSAASPALLVVSGFGAARMLAPESGLHLLEYESAHEESARAVARVRVAPTPDVVPEDPARRRGALVEAVTHAAGGASVVRRYRLDSSPLVRDGIRGWRTGRADLVLDGHFDVLADVLGRDGAAREP